MDYNGHIQHQQHHQSVADDVDTKPFMLHDLRSQQHVQPGSYGTAGGHRLSHHHHVELPSTSSMEVIKIEGNNSNSVINTRSVHNSYEYDGGGNTPQYLNGSTTNLSSPSCQVESPVPSTVAPSSPAPLSAAAEYLRHQEINRGQPRKRIYQDWNQVAVFTTPTDAEEGIKNFENCRWRVGNKFTSREGFKVYWSCREGANCPVQIHLLYHSQLPRVVLFRNQPSHHHVEKVKTRGLLPEVELLIRELFNSGINKPRRIQFILQKKGMEEIPQTKLSNFLVKLRREAATNGGTVVPVGTKRTRGSSLLLDEFDEDEDDLPTGQEEDGPFSNTTSHEDKSGNELSPAMFPSVILTTPHDHQHPQQHHHQPPQQHHQQQQQLMHGASNNGNSATPNYPHHQPMNPNYLTNTSATSTHYVGVDGRYPTSNFQRMSNEDVSCAGDGSMYSPNSLAPSSSSVYTGKPSTPLVSASAVKDDEADQSESVVTCSSSRTRSLYCRDESTEEGEQCFQDEDNIKDLILNHIKTSYSNRDFLHIRQELRFLKRENKYTALSRLLAFTAGFLQDTFLEAHEELSSGGTGDTEN